MQIDCFFCKVNKRLLFEIQFMFLIQIQVVSMFCLPHAWKNLFLSFLESGEMAINTSRKAQFLDSLDVFCDNV